MHTASSKRAIKAKPTAVVNMMVPEENRLNFKILFMQSLEVIISIRTLPVLVLSSSSAVKFKTVGQNIILINVSLSLIYFYVD